MKNSMKKAATVAVASSGALVARAHTNADAIAAANRVSTLLIVFGTVFALGVAVVIALIIRHSGR